MYEFEAKLSMDENVVFGPILPSIMLNSNLVNYYSPKGFDNVDFCHGFLQFVNENHCAESSYVNLCLLVRLLIYQNL